MNPTIYAVVPAAGFSRRMGRPKLLLPVEGLTVIRKLLKALVDGGTSETWVLVRDEDHALREELADTGARIVCTRDPTPDMRASVQLLLDALARERSPCNSDAWLLAPADHPHISPQVVQALIADWRRDPGGIVAPVHKGRRGHPTLLGWPYAALVRDIPDDAGLNWLLRDHATSVREVPIENPGILTDIDTPQDWEQARRNEAQQ